MHFGFDPFETATLTPLPIELNPCWTGRLYQYQNRYYIKWLLNKPVPCLTKYVEKNLLFTQALPKDLEKVVLCFLDTAYECFSYLEVQADSQCCLADFFALSSPSSNQSDCLAEFLYQVCQEGPLILLQKGLQLCKPRHFRECSSRFVSMAMHGGHFDIIQELHKRGCDFSTYSDQAIQTDNLRLVQLFHPEIKEQRESHVEKCVPYMTQVFSCVQYNSLASLQYFYGLNRFSVFVGARQIQSYLQSHSNYSVELKEFLESIGMVVKEREHTQTFRHKAEIMNKLPNYVHDNADHHDDHNINNPRNNYGSLIIPVSHISTSVPTVSVPRKAHELTNVKNDYAHTKSTQVKRSNESIIPKNNEHFIFKLFIAIVVLLFVLPRSIQSKQLMTACFINCFDY